MTEASGLDTPKPPLYGCPFCGKAPHWSLTKTRTHRETGDRFQSRVIQCPSGHSRITAFTNAEAVKKWNTRYD